ncbi:MAG: M18 family aminopeptidase, partial [Lachnospiraceae bacterium]|nr:M18 family aminopeptidase [Lachnospiraceae bacterium]
GKYYVTRNDSSIIAFKIPCKDFHGFQIMASHSDAPAFKVKENPEIAAEQRYTKLNVEKYGGMLCAPWFDRPLSVAGRIMVKDGNRILPKLVDVDKDLLMIPNLAIHMNREANEGYKYNAQVDMLPLLGDETAKGNFMKIVAEAAGVNAEDIIGNDLFLYNRQEGTVWGANNEYISSAKLDDLECAYASLQGIIEGENPENVCVHCVLDNEEVGSGTKQGAASTFLKDTLMRINRAMDRTEEQYHTALASGFMISADNAHAVHPNKGEKSDPTNRPYPNGGIVIKFSGSQKYTTDAVSAAILRMICEKAEVPVQVYLNHSDIPGGSTLGNISSTQVPLNTADIGVAQLAMHSPYETGGVKDVTYLIQMAKTFFGSCIILNGDDSYEIR